MNSLTRRTFEESNFFLVTSKNQSNERQIQCYQNYLKKLTKYLSDFFKILNHYFKR